MTREQVVQQLNIGLSNYEELTSQLSKIKELCDIERAKCYVKGVAYDIDKVKSSTVSMKLEEMVDNINKIVEERGNNIVEITKQLKTAEVIYREVLKLPKDHEDVLLRLYYPRKTLEEVAQELGTNKRWLFTRKEKAINLLTARLKNL